MPDERLDEVESGLVVVHAWTDEDSVCVVPVSPEDDFPVDKARYGCQTARRPISL